MMNNAINCTLWLIDAQVLRILEGDVIIDHAQIEPTPLSSSINGMIYSNYMNYSNPQSHGADELNNIMRSSRGNFNGNRSGRSSSSDHCGKSNRATAINSSNLLHSCRIASNGPKNRMRTQQHHQHHHVTVNPNLYSKRFSGFTNDDHELEQTDSSPSSLSWHKSY